MCGACYSGFADVAGTSAPFVAGAVAAGRARLHRGLVAVRSVFRPAAATAQQPELHTATDDESRHTVTVDS